jgi:Fe-S oxidoreductase
VPLVVPEPSCCASFRDELVEMLPHNQQAQRLSKQTFTLAEFLDKYAPDAELPHIEQRALVQKHCHHQSVMGFDAEQKVFDRLGLQAEIPDSGCCGLAGSWGFEKEKYDISMQCGERVIFPAVRDAAPDTVLLADGFSCRTQIEQGTDRQPVHLAQLIRDALPAGTTTVASEPARRGVSWATAAFGAAAVATAAGVAGMAGRRRSRT